MKLNGNFAKISKCQKIAKKCVKACLQSFGRISLKSRNVSHQNLLGDPVQMTFLMIKNFLNCWDEERRRCLGLGEHFIFLSFDFEFDRIKVVKCQMRKD